MIGLIRDGAGSYQPAFVLVTGLIAVSLLLALFFRQEQFGVRQAAPGSVTGSGQS